MHASQLVSLFCGMAAATSFQAWFSPDCTSGAGSVVTVHGTGSCEKVDGRYSYKVIGDNCNFYYYNADGCNGGNYVGYYYASNGQCVGTGGKYASVCVIGNGNGQGNCATK